MENGNWRILVLWKTRIGEFSFSGKSESENSCFVENANSEILEKREFLFCGKREFENSRFVENQNQRTFFFFIGEFVCRKTRIREFFFFFYRRILVLWKTGTGEFSFGGKPESENFFFFLSENSRFVENGNWRILVFWKTRIGELFFIFFLSENFRFLETENSRFVENGNWRILVL